jgi:hypothetical protein
MIDRYEGMIGIGSVDLRGDSVKTGAHKNVWDMELTVSFGVHEWGLA